MTAALLALLTLVALWLALWPRYAQAPAEPVEEPEAREYLGWEILWRDGWYAMKGEEVVGPCSTPGGIETAVRVAEKRRR